MQKNKTIAARVTTETARILNELSKRESLSRSEIIERALVSYARKSSTLTARELIEKFDENGYLGGHATSENLSSNYKQVLTKSLQKKYDYR